MPPKIIKSTNKEDYVPEKKRYTKPKPFIQPDTLTQYFLERDRVIYKTTKSEQTKKDILERYGVKT